MKDYKIPAVVIGGGINGLGIIRNLGENGIDVYCAVENKNDIAIYSKYCKGYFAAQGIESNLQVLDDFLKKFEKRVIGKAVLFPTSDLAVLNVSQLRGKLDSYLVTMPKHEVLETLIIKRKFYESLERMGIPHAKTLYPDRENFEDIKKKLQYPVFIKPSVSPIFAERFPGKKGFIANSERELQYYLSLVKKYQIDVMVQEIIQGSYENHYTIGGYFNKNSEPIILFAKSGLRAPSSFSNPSATISIPISEVPEIKDMTVKYLTSINYRGLFHADFKLDSRDKAYKFIEVNARSWWNNYFLTVCGVNVIFIAYREAVGEEVEPMEKYEPRIYNIYLFRDLMTTFSKEADLSERFQFRKQLQLYMKRKYYSDYSRDDPKPFLVSLLTLFTSL